MLKFEDLDNVEKFLFKMTKDITNLPDGEILKALELSRKQDEKQPTNNRTGMSFKEAYSYMIQGKKIKRPMWGGYWFINHLTGRITIHLAEGKEISEQVDMQSTIMNVLADDWLVL